MTRSCLTDCTHCLQNKLGSTYISHVQQKIPPSIAPTVPVRNTAVTSSASEARVAVGKYRHASSAREVQFVASHFKHTACDTPAAGQWGSLCGRRRNPHLFVQFRLEIPPKHPWKCLHVSPPFTGESAVVSVVSIC